MSESKKLIDNFNSITDYNKLQTHVIFNYMPFTSNELTSEFISEMVKNMDNKFNFSLQDKIEPILEKNITKEELESLLPELNSLINTQTTQKIIQKQGNQGDEISIEERQENEKQEIIKNQGNQGDENTGRGGTRTTKRQKKTPPKRNKHHTARKHT